MKLFDRLNRAVTECSVISDENPTDADNKFLPELLEMASDPVAVRALRWYTNTSTYNSKREVAAQQIDREKSNAILTAIASL
jgi:hypothetical protein